MLNGYKIVTVCPAGRERYMALLARHMVNNRGLIDRHEWWLNTDNPTDTHFIKELARVYAGYFELVECPGGLQPVNMTHRIHRWYTRCADPGTIYVRLDDDMVWMDPKAMRTLLEFRLANPWPFLVYPNIVNNSYIGAVQQRLGAIPDHVPHVDLSCWNVALLSSDWAEMVHSRFMEAWRKDGARAWQFDQWKVLDYARVSINCICWFGRDFRAFKGRVGTDEEQWLSVVRPRELSRPNIICGRALMAHFAYHTQREQLDQTGLLRDYQKL